jgi:ureidoglycolate lyase
VCETKIVTMKQNLRARPITTELYAPFGNVIEAQRSDVPGLLINQGTAYRYNHLVALENHRPEAQANLAVFRVTPLASSTLQVNLLEKHPYSTQVFLPMNAGRYLVVVAPGDLQPEWEHTQGFIVSGTQGISYAPGVWHHPIIALDTVTDFSCLVWEDQSSGDGVVSYYEPPSGDTLEITIPDLHASKSESPNNA